MQWVSKADLVMMILLTFSLKALNTMQKDRRVTEF